MTDFIPEIRPNANKIHTLYRLSGNLLICANVFTTIPVMFGGTARGKITSFSERSACRMRRYLRECVADYQYFITLTYPFTFERNGRVCKEHLRKFCQKLKREISYTHPDSDRFSLFWFFEFQERGAPHFHIFSTHPISKQWLSKTWFEIVGSDDERHLKAGTRVEKFKAGKRGQIAYVTKYAAKLAQKTIPAEFENSGRFWGIVGLRNTVSATIMLNDLTRANSGCFQAEKRLQKRIKELKEREFIKEIVRKPNIRVYVVNDPNHIAWFEGIICRIAMKILANTTVSNYFDYSDYSDCSYEFEDL